MATPLGDLKFHSGPKPVTSASDHVPQNVMDTGNMLQEQYGFGYPSLLSKEVEFSASSLIPLWITGRKNNVPNLVGILWDIYCQWKLTNIAKLKDNPDSLSLPKNYSFEYFLLMSPLGENMNFTAKKMKLLVKGMKEYHFNYFWPISRSPVAFIKDSFASMTKHTISISQCVNAVIAKTKHLLPLHLDFWIIPKSIMIRDQNSDSNDPQYFEQIDDVIMNIEKRLKLGRITYKKSEIKNVKDMSSIGISQLLSRKIIEALGDKQSHQRLMTIIDRRSQYFDFDVDENKEEQIQYMNHVPFVECNKTKKLRNTKEEIYFYGIDHKFGAIPKDYISERLLFNTQQWMLPFFRFKNSNNDYLWKNQMFILSFHIHSVNDIKVYWHLNGNLMRFLPKNMLDIWPYYFYNDKELKKDIKEMDYKQIQKQWKLKVTDKVFDQYYAELIPE